MLAIAVVAADTMMCIVDLANFSFFCIGLRGNNRNYGIIPAPCCGSGCVVSVQIKVLDADVNQALAH